MGKKAWVLERFVEKEENVHYLTEVKKLVEELEEKGINPGSNSADVQKMIDEAEAQWTPVYWSNNYFTFCSKVKGILRQADEKEISKLKESLGKVTYSPEVNAKFRETHNSVKATYRVASAEDFEGDIKNELVPPKFVGTEVNQGVYSYLWNSMNQYKGRSK